MESVIGNTRKVDITFFSNGKIDISSRISKALALQKGDVLDILNGNGELYLYVRMHAPTVGRYEAMCFPTHENSWHFRAWSKNLCQYMIKRSGSSLNKIQICAGDLVTLPGNFKAFPLIYKNVLNDKRN